MSCFLAVQTRVWDSSIPTPCTSLITRSFYFLTSKSDPRDLWPLRHMIRVMMRHDLTNKKTMTKTNTKTKTMTMTMTMTNTNTFGEHIQRVILETCDFWDIWSEWWWDMARPKKEIMTKTHTKTKNKFGPNWKPLGFAISTSSPTNHRKQICFYIFHWCAPGCSGKLTKPPWKSWIVEEVSF